MANQTDFPIGAQGTAAIYTSGEHGAWAALRKISIRIPLVAELALSDQFLKRARRNHDVRFWHLSGPFQPPLRTSAFEGKADRPFCTANVRFWPKADSTPAYEICARIFNYRNYVWRACHSAQKTDELTRIYETAVCSANVILSLKTGLRLGLGGVGENNFSSVHRCLDYSRRLRLHLTCRQRLRSTKRQSHRRRTTGQDFMWAPTSAGMDERQPEYSRQ